MSHTYSALYFHCIFSTKDRKDSIPDDLRDKFWAYIEGIAKNIATIPVAVGGTSNHAHLLIAQRPNQPIAEVVQKVKANSSRWMGEHGLAFEWQKGYAVLSVSPSAVGKVRAYVLNQEEHHRKRSFDEEYLALLRKAGIRCDAATAFAA